MDATKMLQTINQAMDGTGVQCKLQRRTGEDVYRDVDHKDMMEADLSMRCRLIAERLQHLSRDEKMAWAVEERRRGNELFEKRDYREALFVYMQSLMGLDLHGADEKRAAAVRDHQVPVTNNMAVCCYQQGQFRKCEALCTQCLAVDPESYKALFRRGMARIEIGDLEAAKEDFRSALAVTETEAQQRSCRSKLRLIAAEAKKQKLTREKLRAAYASVMDPTSVRPRSTQKTVIGEVAEPLYADKVEVLGREVPSKKSKSTGLAKKAGFRSKQASDSHLRFGMVAAVAVGFALTLSFLLS